MAVLDSPLLQSTLRDELRAAWIKIRDEHADERLYGFGVYTTDSASYLMVTAFSEKALDDNVATSVANFSEGGKHSKLRKSAISMGGTPDDPVLQRQSLRWSPCDSPLHEKGAGLLPRSDKIVQELDFEGRWDGDEDDDDDFDDELQEPEVAEVFQIAVQVLRELDREGVFGVGAERERLVLSVWQGDQSNLARHAFAKTLNPPTVATRFGREMNDGLRAYYKLYMADEELPADDVFN